MSEVIKIMRREHPYDNSQNRAMLLEDFLTKATFGYKSEYWIYYQEFKYDEVFTLQHDIGIPFVIFKKGKTATLEEWVKIVKEYYPEKDDLAIVSDIIKARQFVKQEAEQASI